MKIQEAEGQIITDYVVCAPGQSDRDLWVPALEQHAALFGHAPQLAVADGGFASRTNERGRRTTGSATSSCRGGEANAARARRGRALQWRTGSEGRISALKRCHGLRRCRYRGAAGMERWVGLGVIANNLTAIARARTG